MCPKAESFSKRNFKNFDQEAFLRNFNSVPFSVAYLFKDPDHEKNHVLDDHAPVISPKKRSLMGSKFTTTDIRKALRERGR